MTFNHTDEHLDEAMLVVQANIDDMNPELCSFVADKLFDAGANDVYWIPIIMKKGRPGIMLNILVQESKLSEIETIVFRETTTLGLRYTNTNCHRLERQFVKVNTPWGEMTIKAGYHRGELVQFAPEFLECEEVAKKYNIPLKTVYDVVRRRFMEK